MLKMIQKTIPLIKQELAMLKSEKTILAALLIQIFVASFSSYLVVGLISLYNPSSTTSSTSLDMAVAGDGTSHILNSAESELGVSAKEYDTFEKGFTAFKNGKVDVFIHSEKKPSGRYLVTVIAPDSGMKRTIAVVKSKSLLKDVQKELRQVRGEYISYESIKILNKGPSNPYFSFVYTVLIPILMLFPAFISGSLMTDSIIEDRMTGRMSLLQVSPLNAVGVLVGKGIAMLSLVPIQTALWIGLLHLNGTPIYNPLALVLVTTAFAVLNISWGAFAGAFTDGRGSAQLVYSLGIISIFSLGALAVANPANILARVALGSTTTKLYFLGALYGVFSFLSAVGVLGVTQEYGFKSVKSGIL